LIRMTPIAWGLVLAFVIWFVAGLLLFGNPASSHEWFTGKQNPETGQTCCNDKDCLLVEVQPLFVTKVDPETGVYRDYYRVLYEGMWHDFPATQTLPSEDNKAWGCKWPNYPGMDPELKRRNRHLRCLFLPPSS